MRKRSYNDLAERTGMEVPKERKPVSSFFGENTFNKTVMQKKLPRPVFLKLMACIEENIDLDLDTANAVSHAMKEWAIENGATHFAHWFQPLTGATAEKHDAFIEFSGTSEVIERFSGSQLVQGEPDASSFPSGGLRATFEARGYTAWDMSSPAFLMKNGLGITLCIPSVFISYTGEALDKKTPLLRSIRAVNDSAVKVLKILGNKTSLRVQSNLGPEQEYFLIDESFYRNRQDLVLAGRTLLGASPAKGQELEDQYFGSIKERVQSFMHDLDQELFRFGIPAKTRHNEVAPSQFEIAPIYEEANVAVDHNQLLMDTMKKIAKRHSLAALIHEKPFAGINGSGKHLNWSLSTDDGINLLNPGKTVSENVQFLVFLFAVIRSVYKHGDLLRASIASASNDHRLGANEAPPAIISIFLGDQLTEILEKIEKGEEIRDVEAKIIDLDLSSLPLLSKDNTDRNRTSPFAFTGNKFEFRAVGSSQSIAFPATVINTIVAESLEYVAEKLKNSSEGDLKKAVLEMIRNDLKECKAVLFAGDNYSDEWHKEAERRGLPNNRTTPEALLAMNSEKAKKLFSSYGVLSEIELHSRYHIKLEAYAKEIEIEARAFNDIINTSILPAAYNYQKTVASSLRETASMIGEESLVPQKEMLKRLSSLISKVQSEICELKKLNEKAGEFEDEQKKAEYLCETVKTRMEELRVYADELETLVDDSIWPLPKFWEMLFLS